MTAFADRGATINRLRIRCRGIDPLLARLRAGRLLDESAIQPAGLPASAILCIRRLSDPHPGLVALDGAQPTPALWSEAVAASVRDMARGARRPGLGDVTPGADAVLFADRAEMLACLAADWCAGQLNAHWWWRALLGDVGEARAVLRAWLKAPEYIAAALDEIACRGGAAIFAGRLADADARALVDAVIVQHDLPWLAAAFEGRNSSRQASGALTMRSDSAVTYADRDTPSARAVPRAPWTERVPESLSPSLRPGQQCLLGIALMTRRAPTVVRTPCFAADVQRWLDFSRAASAREPDASSQSAGRSRDQARTEDGRPVTRVPHHDASSAGGTAETDAPPTAIAQSPASAAHSLKVESHRDARLAVQFQPHEAVARSTESRVLSEPPARGVEFRPHGREAPLPRVDAVMRPAQIMDGRADPGACVEAAAERQSTKTDAPTSSILQPGRTLTAAPVFVPPFSPPAGVRPTLATRPGHVAQTIVPDVLAPAEPATSPPIPRVYPASLETEVGGIFYLLNVALRLGVYGDFTTPAQPGIGLSIWDFLTLVGRALTPRHLYGDPVWLLLADLAGRGSDEAPAAAFDPPDAWRIPSEWLDAFTADGTWRWREREGRLRVVHPAGFAVVDVPRDGEAIEQLERELLPYHVSRGAVRSAARRGSSRGSVSALTRWMRCLLPYVRARLARALGTSPRHAAALLCVQHARVSTTATHVDVFFRLADLPIEVRVSGLDRNPGWVPAADRVMTFHYD